MSDDVKVTISADISQMVAGMNTAAGKLEEAVKGMTGNLDKLATSSRDAGKAHEGMTGSISASIKEYAAGAAAGFTMAGAIEKCVGFAKDWIASIPEMIRSTGELAESFKGLRYETGASLDQLNTMHAALLLEGKSADELQTLFLGSQKGIKANADALVANGVAADKAALIAMPFEDYLRRVDDLAQKFASSTERAQFLMLALGKSGAAAGTDLHELVERMEEAKKLTENGGPISERSIQQMEEGKTALGRLNLQQEIYAANVSSHSASILTWWHNLRADTMEAGNEQNVVNRYLDAGLISADRYAIGVNRAFGPLLDQIKKLREEWEKIAASSMDAGAHFGAADKKTGHLQAVPGKTGGTKAPKIPKAYVDEEVLSFNEMSEWSEKYLAKQKETQDKVDKEAAKYAEKWRQDKAEYLNDVSEIKQKTAAALYTSQTIKGGITDYLKQSREELKQWGLAAKATAQQIEGTFAQSTKGMLTGQMTLSQGLKNLWQGVSDAVVGMIAEMFAKWATSKLAEMIIGKTTATSEAAGGAAAYAVAAMQSVAAIPMVGWAMAPGVGAAAYATGMGYAALASAAGGWDRVPSDQLAQIHKNEMILPAPIAEAARQTFAGGGGATEIHFHGVTDGSWWKAQQGNIIKTINEAVTNRRKN